MKTVNISLFSDNSMERVKVFVRTITEFKCDMDLLSGRYVIDAKSILGIFSLDLSKPITLSIHTNDEAELTRITEALSDFIVE